MKNYLTRILLISFVISGLLVACTKNDSNNNAAVNNVTVQGTHLASAIGNDASYVRDATIELQLNFYGVQHSAFTNTVYAQGSLKLLQDPYGCPYLQNLFYSGVREIPLSTLQPGTMTSRVFNGIQLQSTSGNQLSLIMNGHLVPTNNVYALESDIVFQQCPIKFRTNYQTYL